jgi:hypothetical protein
MSRRKTADYGTSIYVLQLNKPRQQSPSIKRAGLIFESRQLFNIPPRKDTTIATMSQFLFAMLITQ